MKNKTATALFIFMLSQAAPASEIKAMLGLNSGKYIFSSEINSLNRQQKTGFGIGLGWAFKLKRNMKLEINALYSQKGAKASIAYTPDKTVSGFYKNTSIGLPVFFKYQFKEKASPYIALGPEFVFVFSHNFIIPESGDDLDLIDNTKKFILAFNATLGYEWPIGQWGLFAEVRYSRWLSNFLIDPEITAKSESFTFLLGGVYYL
jgi:opacity protein-like surface antigen